jgi:zinc transporter 2
MKEKKDSKNKEALTNYISSSKTNVDVSNALKGKHYDHDEEKNLSQNESPILAENTKHNQETLRKLWIVSVICLVFMIIEIIAGYMAGSIAIMSDAAHLLSDFLGFMISIVSIYISRRKATDKMSFGYHRAEVIGALVSVNIIWGLTIWLLYEASMRLIYNQRVNGLIMLITAIIGFLFNIIMGLVLMHEGIGI